MSFHPPKPWLKGEVITAERLQDLQTRGINNIIVRPPLTMIRNGSSVSIFLPEQPRQASPTIAIEIAEHLSDGVYGVIIGRPKTDVQFNPSVHNAGFTFHDFGYALAEGQTYNAIFVNKAEEGKSGHWLDVGGHYYSSVLWTGSVEGGKTLYVGHTFDTQLCEEAP